MAEQTNNAKCPHCGAELYLGYDQGTGFCPVCRKEFDNKKAVQLYKSIYEITPKEEEKKKLAFGEDYLEVERIITRAEYFFDRKDFRKAREELEKGLEITNTDYRLYFGIVRAETQNLTDYKNTSHKEYLDKALNVADSEEKKIIMRLYKDFYHLSNLSEEDVLQYKKEENVAVKKKLEERLKLLIPVYMKKERKLKIFLIMACLFAVLFIASGVVGLILDNNFILSVSIVFIAFTYVFSRKFLTGKKFCKLFNALLDVYDALDSFHLEVSQFKEVLDQMKLLRKCFDAQNNVNECEDGIMRLSSYLHNNATENARKFINSHPVLKGYAFSNSEE